MSDRQPDNSTPFDTIEGAQEFVALLQHEIEVAHEEISGLIGDAKNGPQRRAEALQLVLYKLSILRSHMEASQRVLHDLQVLRRLLLPTSSE